MARSSRSAAWPMPSGSCPLMRIVPALTRPLRGRYLTSASATVDLPEPDSPDQPVRLAPADGERHVPQRAAVLPPHLVRHVHVRDDQRPVFPAISLAHEFSTCSIESVIRLTAVTSEAMASAGNSTCHQ